MSAPYLPAGVSSLPATRIVLFADNNNVVQKIAESTLTRDGTTDTPYWVSPSLNRKDQNRLYSISLLTFYYTSTAASSFTVKVSGNGGETWAESRTVTVEATAGEEIPVTVSFNTTGKDLRFKIEFNLNAVILITGYRPYLIERGSSIYA